MAPLRCVVKFDPFPSLDCARRKGRYQICHLATLSPSPSSSSSFPLPLPSHFAFYERRHKASLPSLPSLSPRWIGGLKAKCGKLEEIFLCEKGGFSCFGGIIHRQRPTRASYFSTSPGYVFFRRLGVFVWRRMCFQTHSAQDLKV